jgi:signal peptide peptidase SppA
MKKINNLFFCRPWAVKEDILKVMIEIVDRHMQGVKLTATEIEAKTGGGKPSRDYEVIDKAAYVPIYGLIAKRANMINGISQPQGTSIEQVRNDFKAALNDKAVDRIVLDIDSPGGSVDGVSELSNFIFKARGKKPITAYANGMMASAAYWIGSAADKIYASDSAEVGSIGVYATIYDYTVANHMQGVKAEIIKAGRYKAAGHPDKPMTDEDRLVIQDEVNTYFDLFMKAVQRNRHMSLEQVQQVANGRVYIGAKAFDIGLVDGIDDLDSNPILSSAAVRAEGGVEPQADAGVQIDVNQNKNKEEYAMDFKLLTIDLLKSNRADLCEAIAAEGKAIGLKEGKDAGILEGREAALKEGKDAGAQEERNRVLGILEASKVIPGVEGLVPEAVKAGETVEASLTRFKDHRLSSLQKVAPKSAGPAAEEATGAVLSLEDRCKKEFEASEALRAEFGSLGTYLAYMKADGAGRVKILKK